MAADRAVPGVGGLTFAVELNEAALEHRILLRRSAVVALEGRLRLARHIVPAGRQVGILGVAKILRALPAVREICDALQVAAAAVTGRNRPERPVGFADDVEAMP